MTEATADQQLDALDSQAAEMDTTPEQEAEQKEAQQEAVTISEGARSAADMMAGIMGALVDVFAPGATVSDSTKKQAADKLQPVFEKYGIALGGVGSWNVEIDAAVFFGMAGFTIYQQIQANNAEQAVNDEQGAGSGNERKHEAGQ